MPDRQANDFARAVEAELPFLQKSAWRWCREQAPADDLVQDTVMRALTKAHRYHGDRPDSDLRGWLFVVMRNCFLRGVRQSRRHDAALDRIAAAGEGAAAATSQPDARLVIRDLDRALARLSPDQRAAIRLIAIEGLSYNAAAHLMGVSRAAVASILWRGRKRLHEAGREASP